MEETAFSSFLLGRLVSMEARLRQELTPPPEPAAPLIAREPTAAEANQHFLDHVQEIAGVKPPQQVAQEAAPPATLSRSSPTFQRQFAKWAEAVATGQTEIVE